MYRNFTPRQSGRWRNVVSVDEISDSDYLVIINAILGGSPVNYIPERILYFKREPEAFAFPSQTWTPMPPGSHIFKAENGYFPNHWMVNKTYDELKLCGFPTKVKRVSWVTSNTGDGGYSDDKTEVLRGHRSRMTFLRRFFAAYPGVLDLYGRGFFMPEYMRRDVKGEIYDKWDGLAEYRYTFAFENEWEPGYFSEKILDAVLAGCMPIYWGCPDLERYFPEGSFIRLDIEASDAPERAMNIVMSDYREKNLAALQEAKRRALTEYNFWEMLCLAVNRLDTGTEKPEDIPYPF